MASAPAVARMPSVVVPHRRWRPVRCAHPAGSRAWSRAPGAPWPAAWRRWVCWWTEELIWRRRDTLAGSGGAPL